MADDNKTRTGSVINQRLRNGCDRAEKSDVIPKRKFTLDLAYHNRWDRFEVTRKVCSNLAGQPRWLLDVCTIMPQGTVQYTREVFAATNLPLVLEVIQAPTRPYTLAQEAQERRAKRPYRELPSTANFRVYADREKPHYGETYFWIRKDSANPGAFACGNSGNNIERLLRCKVRYVRGANLIRYEFEAEPGREEETFARINARIQDILTELAASP